MNSICRVRFTLLSLPILLLLGVPIDLSAQFEIECRGEPTEIPWVIPPALAAIDGDSESFEPAVVFVGDRKGALQIWELAFGTLGNATTLEPGNGLPSNVTGIWAISVLSESDVVALVTYTAADSEWYGFLRSNDRGESWTLVEPASLQTAHFASVEGTFSGGADWTGNYFRAPLYEMEWLQDGLHGWAWGRQGIVRTADGGATWTVVYETDAVASLGNADYKTVWGLAMRTPEEGVAVIGARIGATSRRTTDGGASWITGTNLAVERLADLEAVGGEYRALRFNGQERQDNTFYYVSSDGQNWEQKKDLGRKLSSETVYPTEIVWTSRSDGFLVQRQGEIWRTSDGGTSWELEQEVDPQYDTVKHGDGTSIGDYPYAGYAQRTVAVRDDFGDPYLINVITDSCNGAVRPYIPVWPVSEFSSVPTDSRPSTLDLTLLPNPATDRCEVRFTLAEPSAISLSIVDVTGATVRQVDLGRHEAGVRQFEVSLADLVAGAYRIVVRGSHGESSASVIVGTE